MRQLSRPLRVAVIGSGPSGFFACQALLCQDEVDVSIDLIERLPTPYGLVRYGVAPDHAKIKAVTKVYQKVGVDPRLRFLGNVSVAKDLSRSDLKRHYDVIIYAVGAASDRNLGIDGEDLSNSLSATEFVAWYNGHPDYTQLDLDVAVTAVAVIGMGNVAADVARILAKKVDALATTDIADHALARLANSQVEDIYLLGRRGPAQTKFTSKELREFGNIDGCDVIVDPADLDLDEASLAAIQNDLVAKKNLEIFKEFSERKPTQAPRRLHFMFRVSPQAIIGDTVVEALAVEHNRLEPTETGYINAVGTGHFSTLPVGMVLRSVGYKGVALPGIPFDDRRGIIPNLSGRLLSHPGGTIVAGEYVTGWIKRGPSGVIGTNKPDAIETVNNLLEDVAKLSLVPDAQAAPEAISALLKARGIRPMSFVDWLELDAYETAKGKSQGRPRVKMTSVELMLEIVENKAVVG